MASTHPMSPATNNATTTTSAATPLRTVNQCSSCGALTMLARCPNCDAPAVAATGSAPQESNAAAHHTPKTTTFGQQGAPASTSYGTPVSTTIAFSPAASNIGGVGGGQGSSSNVAYHHQLANTLRQPVFIPAQQQQHPIGEPMFLSPTSQPTAPHQTSSASTPPTTYFNNGTSSSPAVASSRMVHFAQQPTAQPMATFVPAAASQPSSRSPSAGIRPTSSVLHHQPPTLVNAPTAAHQSNLQRPGHVAGQPVPVLRASSPTSTHQRSTSPVHQHTAVQQQAAPSGAFQHPSDATIAQLRREVQRLQSELQKRNTEVEALHRDTTNGKVTNQAELQELWHTIRQQSDTLNQSRGLEDELRRTKQELQMAAAERDQLRTELDRSSSTSAANVTRQAHEAEELRSALHRKQLDMLDLEHTVEAAKRQAREAESLLQQHKLKVQQTTAEVVELQRHVEAQRREDHQQLQFLKAEVSRLESDVLTAREDSARAGHELQLANRALADERRNHEREVGILRRSAEEALRLEELLKESQERLNATLEELRVSRNEAREAKVGADATVHERVLAVEREYDAKLTAARRSLADAQAEKRRAEIELEAAQRTANDAVEAERNTRRDADALRRQYDECERNRATLLADLEMEARATSDLRRQLEDLRKMERSANETVVRVSESNTDTERVLSTLRRDLAEAQARARDLPDRCAQLEAQLDATRRRETELMLELSRAKALADNATILAQADADRRVEESRLIERQRTADVQRTVDELRHELRLATEASSKQTAVHSASLAELRTQYNALVLERDTLAAQVERHRALTGGTGSPTRLATEREALKQQLEAARREADHLAAMHRETQVHCDGLRRDLAQARERGEGAQKAADDHRQFVRELREVLAPWMSPAASVTSTMQTADGRPIEHEIVEKVRSIAGVAERADITTRTLQDKVDNAINSLDLKIQDLTKQRDLARREAADSAARIHELEDGLNTAITASDTRVREVYQELQAERDSLEKDTILARRSLAKERDEKNKIVDELRTQIRQLSNERDTLARELQNMASDLEEARSAAADAAKQVAEFKHDAQVNVAMVAHVEQQLRDAKKALQVAQEEKERLSGELLSARAQSGSEVAEASARLEDLRAKHIKETESLKAMIRVERDKILKEIENTHLAAAKASDLELSNESLKADRERLTKELELARAFQASRVDAFHSNVEAVTRERDQLRRTAEEATRKLEAVEHGAAALRNDNATLELALRDAARERDNLARQLQHVQFERDGALRFMSMATPSAAQPSSRPVSPTRHATNAAQSHFDSSLRLDRPSHDAAYQQQQPQHTTIDPRAALMANFREERHVPGMTGRRVSPTRGVQAPAAPLGPAGGVGTPRSASIRSEALPLSAFRR